MSTLVRVKAWFAEALDSPSTTVKQAATTAGMLAAIVILYLVPGIEITNAGLAGVGVVLIAGVSILAVIATHVPRLDPVVMIIPAIDIVAIGCFRGGTGGAISPFAALLILPVIWLASGDGRRHVLYATVLTAFALFLPFLIGATEPNGVVDIVRGLFVPLVYAGAAGIVNELARQGRRQLNSIQALADDKEVMLQRTVEFAARLQESELNYRAADRLFRGVWAAVTEQSVVGTDVTGLIDAWNPGATKILGPSADDAQDKMYIFDFHLQEELLDRARELHYPPGETVLNPGFSALVESARLGNSETREWTYVRADGSHVPVQLSVTKRIDDDGETVGYLFVALDVTQAREVARLKDEFVGLISHELRTPLSSILGYLELLRDDEDAPLAPEQLQYLGVAERNAHRLLRLVGDLLFTAQVESGNFPLDSREVELESIIGASLDTARPAASAAGVEVRQELPAEPALVHGDPTRLGQAIDNLMSNAIKFTPRGGAVTIALELTETSAVVSVRDTGMGIPEAEMDKLFSRFFRATTATRNAVPGVGLGLTITKAIITAHRGQMDVTSEEGVGTKFSVTLPRIRVAARV